MFLYCSPDRKRRKSQRKYEAIPVINTDQTPFEYERKIYTVGDTARRSSFEIYPPLKDAARSPGTPPDSQISLDLSTIDYALHPFSLVSKRPGLSHSAPSTPTKELRRSRGSHVSLDLTEIRSQSLSALPSPERKAKDGRYSFGSHVSLDLGQEEPEFITEIAQVSLKLGGMKHESQLISQCSSEDLRTSTGGSKGHMDLPKDDASFISSIGSLRSLQTNRSQGFQSKPSIELDTHQDASEKHFSTDKHLSARNSRYAKPATLEVEARGQPHIQEISSLLSEDVSEPRDDLRTSVSGRSRVSLGSSHSLEADTTHQELEIQLLPESWPQKSEGVLTASLQTQESAAIISETAHGSLELVEGEHESPLLSQRSSEDSGTSSGGSKGDIDLPRDNASVISSIGSLRSLQTKRSQGFQSDPSIELQTHQEAIEQHVSTDKHLSARNLRYAKPATLEVEARGQPHVQQISSLLSEDVSEPRDDLRTSVSGRSRVSLGSTHSLEADTTHQESEIQLLPESLMQKSEGVLTASLQTQESAVIISETVHGSLELGEGDHESQLLSQCSSEDSRTSSGGTKGDIDLPRDNASVISSIGSRRSLQTKRSQGFQSDPSIELETRQDSSEQHFSIDEHLRSRNLRQAKPATLEVEARGQPHVQQISSLQSCKETPHETVSLPIVIGNKENVTPEGDRKLPIQNLNRSISLPHMAYSPTEEPDQTVRAEISTEAEEESLFLPTLVSAAIQSYAKLQPVKSKKARIPVKVKKAFKFMTPEKEPKRYSKFHQEGSSDDSNDTTQEPETFTPRRWFPLFGRKRKMSSSHLPTTGQLPDALPQAQTELGALPFPDRSRAMRQSVAEIMLSEDVSETRDDSRTSVSGRSIVSLGSSHSLEADTPPQESEIQLRPESLMQKSEGVLTASLKTQESAAIITEIAHGSLELGEGEHKIPMLSQCSSEDSRTSSGATKRDIDLPRDDASLISSVGSWRSLRTNHSRGFQSDPSIELETHQEASEQHFSTDEHLSRRNLRYAKPSTLEVEARGQPHVQQISSLLSEDVSEPRDDLRTSASGRSRVSLGSAHSLEADTTHQKSEIQLLSESLMQKSEGVLTASLKTQESAAIITETAHGSLELGEGDHESPLLSQCSSEDSRTSSGGSKGDIDLPRDDASFISSIGSWRSLQTKRSQGFQSDPSIELETHQDSSEEYFSTDEFPGRESLQSSKPDTLELIAKDQPLGVELLPSGSFEDDSLSLQQRSIEDQGKSQSSYTKFQQEGSSDDSEDTTQEPETSTPRKTFLLFGRKKKKSWSRGKTSRHDFLPQTESGVLPAPSTQQENAPEETTSSVSHHSPSRGYTLSLQSSEHRAASTSSFSTTRTVEWTAQSQTSDTDLSALQPPMDTSDPERLQHTSPSWLRRDSREPLSLDETHDNAADASSSGLLSPELSSPRVSRQETSHAGICMLMSSVNNLLISGERPRDDDTSSESDK